MDVKQVNPSTSSILTPATETRDGDRQRQRNVRNRSREKKSQPSAVTAVPIDGAAEASSDTAAPESQMLDSVKVVELLSQRPQANPKMVATFSRHSREKKSPQPSVVDGKKLNKAL